MGKSKKSASKSQARREAVQNDNTVEARPIGQGKDPLSEGATLHNESNTEAETHYKADNSELNAEEKASKIRGQNANERAEEHNLGASTTVNDIPNSDADEQDSVAEDRVEPSAEVEETPEKTPAEAEGEGEEEPSENPSGQDLTNAPTEQDLEV